MSRVSSRSNAIRRVAREAFGYEAFRPGQEEAIASVLDGRDTLAVMSTGSGKSAIYQIAGLLTPGTTVVVSPLIALQRDQVEHLSETTGGAAELNSTITDGAREEVLAEAAEDALEFIFMAPEQLANEEVLAELAENPPSLFVVDEAHAISDWGHDFRPDYLKLGAAIDALGHPTVLALTATAAPPVRAEILERLALRDPEVIVRGFDRPNLHFAVDRFFDAHHLERALVEKVAEAPKPGILYVATRKRAEELTEALVEHGVRATAYHGGLRGRVREAAQGAFMEDEVDVMVATTAFGMGVDKPNVRWVYHAVPADSLDSYYQEVGRAGRDGEPAEARLFYRSEDLGVRRFFAGSGHVGLDDLATVAHAVQDADGPIEPVELKEETELSQTKLTSALARLEDVGAIEVESDGEVTEAPDAPPLQAAVSLAFDAEANRQEFDRSRIEMMQHYAEERTGCRRQIILAYFGQPFDPPCGNCDNCVAGRTEEGPGDVPFAVGARVGHASWGEGVVQRYEDDQVTVLFETVGYKTLALAVVAERGLLSAA